MLKQLRAATRSWIAGVFVALLILSFAVWGINDVFSGGIGSSVAKVGETQIAPRDFKREVDFALRQQADETGAIMTMEEARDSGLVNQLLNRALTMATLREAARVLSFDVTGTQIRQAYEEIDAFRNPVTERFDPAQAMRVLSQNGLSDRDFERSLRNDLLQNQFTAGLSAGLRPPAPLLDVQLAFLNERRIIDAVLYAPETLPEVSAPDDATLQAFFDERAAQFAVPEARNMDIARFSLAGFYEAVELDPELVEELFQEELARLGAADERDYTILAFADPALAETITARLTAGEPPSEIAATMEGVTLTSREGARGTQIADLELREQVLALSPGEFSEAFEGGIGQRIVYVSRLVAADQPDLDAIRAQVVDDLREEQAGQLLFDALTRFEEARDRGLSLRAASEEAGIDLLTLSGVQRRDASTYDALAEDGAAGDIIERAFNQTERLETETVDLGENGYYALEVTAIEPQRTRTLDEAREEAVAAYIATTQRDGFNTTAQAMRTALEDGTSLLELQNLYGDDIATQRVDVRRIEGNQSILPQQAVAAAFGINVGETTMAPAGENAVIMLRVADALVEPGSGDPRLRDQISQQFELGLANGVVSAVILDLQEEFEVRRDQQNFNNALGLTAAG